MHANKAYGTQKFQVAFIGDISEYSTRISISLSLVTLVNTILLNNTKICYFVKLIILENVLDKKHKLQPSLKCHFSWSESQIHFAAHGYELYSTIICTKPWSRLRRC